MRNLRGVAGVVLCALSPTGCKEVQYKAATSHDEVVAIGAKTVPSGQDAGIDVDGTRLRIQVARLCNVVEDKEILRKHVRESDENVLIEGAVMGFATIPLAIGIGLLADAPRVYDKDPNQRLYNPTGKKSATTLGGIALGFGIAMFIPSTVSMVRRKLPKVEEETVHGDGDTVALGVPCHDQRTVGGMGVQGRLDNGRSLGLGTTGADGRLQVDLAGLLVPAELGGPDEPTTLEVSINGQSYATVDLGPALEVHATRRERHWQQANARRCDADRSEEACSEVRRFVQLYPKSVHVREANALLANIGKPRRIPQ
jgi:hypothetical protein